MALCSAVFLKYKPSLCVVCLRIKNYSPWFMLYGFFDQNLKPWHNMALCSALFLKHKPLLCVVCLTPWQNSPRPPKIAPLLLPLINGSPQTTLNLAGPIVLHPVFAFFSKPLRSRSMRCVFSWSRNACFSLACPSLRPTKDNEFSTMNVALVMTQYKILP